MYAIQNTVTKQLYQSNGKVLTFLHPDNAGWWIHTVLTDAMNWTIAYIG